MEIIEVGLKLESICGYLSNDSGHGFYEPENVWWPSVTHFLEAKKFEGTQYEDIIRRSKTVRQAKRLTRERNVLIMVSSTDGDGEIGNTYDLERRKVYGIKRNGYNIKAGWIDVREGYLRIALRRKFHQHPRLRQKLLDTHPRPITSIDRNQTAKVLTEIRDALFEKRTPKKTSIPGKENDEVYSAPVANMAHDASSKGEFVDDLDLELANSPTCHAIRDTIMKLAKYVSEMEGWDRVFSEMVDDAFFNIYSNHLPQKWISKNLKKSSHVDRPNLNRFAAETRELFTQIDPFQWDTDTPSQKIANFIFWCTYREGRTKSILRRLRRFIDVQNSDGSIKFDDVHPSVMIPPGRRWYRNKRPPKLKLQ